MLTRDELLKKMDEELRMGRGLDGALSVAIDELLGQPNALEFDAAINATMREMDAKYHPDGSLHQYAMCKILLAARRAKLERVKTPAEKVTEIIARHGFGEHPDIANEIIQQLKDSNE
jgi:hypothetical protein